MRKITLQTSTLLGAKDLEDLSPVQRRVAEYIDLFPREAELLSITDLAQAAHVCPATVTKLCHNLGYQDFRTFRLEVARTNAQRTTAPKGQGGDSLAGRARASLSRAARILERTSATLDLAAFKEAVEALDKAERVVIFGVGGSGAIAMDAHFRFLRIGVNAVAHTDTQVQLWSTTTLKPTDVVIAVSHSGRTKDTVEALSLARASGCRTVALVSHRYSPLAKSADICLVSAYEATPSNEGGVMARFSQLGIIDALAEELAHRHPEHIDRAEKVVSALRARNR